MIKKHLTGLEIETTARTCRRFRHARKGREKSSLYLEENISARHALRSMLRRDRQRKLMAAAKEESIEDKTLICWHCMKYHPRTLFTPEEQAKTGLERVCVGATGIFRFCDHVNVNFEDISRFQRGYEHEFEPCLECKSSSLSSGTKTTAMILMARRTAMHHPDFPRKHAMLVHIFQIPLNSVGYGGYGKELRNNLAEITADDSRPVCRHLRVMDLINLLDDSHFDPRGVPARFADEGVPARCTAPDCYTEFTINSLYTEVVDLVVRRCLGTGRSPADPEWLSAMSKDVTAGSKVSLSCSSRGSLSD